METLKLHDKYFKPYMKEAEIMEAIDGVADKINADFKGCTDVPVLLCVLNGAVVFAGELMKRLKFDLELASMKVTSYVGTHSTGEVRMVNGINGNIVGKRVIICEDIVDTGNSMEFLLDELKKLGAVEVRICTMLFKPDVFKKSFKLDYVGKSIPNDFIVGFGLDYDELGRNLKDIYVIDNNH